MAILVLGMHRSGTSAITRLINLYGPRVSKQDDLLLLPDDNPRGHWESVELYKLNDVLLLSMGGAWCVPPLLPNKWWELDALVPYRQSAWQSFHKVYDTRYEWVWKDPRNCLTLPFWLFVLGCRPAIVLIHRNPLEVHASLARRNGHSRELAVAVWSWYNCSAFQNIRGLPLFVLSYEKLLETPLGVLQRLETFLKDHGAVLSASVNESQVAEFLTPELRHWQFRPEDVARSSLLPEEKALYEYLLQIPERHDSFAEPVPSVAQDTVLSGLQAMAGHCPWLAQLKRNVGRALSQAGLPPPWRH